MATRRYGGDGIEVTYDVGRCIHAEECVHGLPAVFDPSKKPWVQLGGADAERVATVVERCPTGALRYERSDGVGEEPPRENVLRPAPDGPLYGHGDFVLRAGGAEVDAGYRIALCRCGASANKPFCDGSHTRAGFEDAGSLPKQPAVTVPAATGPGKLEITASTNGPLLLRGPVALTCAVTGAVVRAPSMALCRCGSSASKPFCDGSHVIVGFEG